MASTPDPNPDSIPAGPSDDPERVSQADVPARRSIEDIDAADPAARPDPGDADDLL